MAILPLKQADWLSLRRLIARATHDAQHAEDCLQYGFVKLLAQRRPVDNVEGFLVTVARNLTIDDARKTNARRELRLDSIGSNLLPSDEALPDEVVAARKRLQKVTATLNTLPTRTRRIFLMHRLDGLRYREIAARERVSVSSVEKHIARAVLHITRWDDAD